MTITEMEPRRRERVGASRLSALAEDLASYAACLDADVSLLDGAEAAVLAETAGQIERLAAVVKTLAAGRVEETDHARALGRHSVERWLADATKVSFGEAAKTLQTASFLGDEKLGIVRSAFVAGSLTATQANEILKASDKRPEAQDKLLAFAAQQTTARLRDECRKILLADKPEEPERRRKRIVEEMAFRTRNLGEGMSELVARMPTSWLLMIKASVQAQCEAIFAKARAEGRDDPHQAYLVEALMTLVLFGDLTGTGYGDAGPFDGDSEGAGPFDAADEDDEDDEDDEGTDEDEDEDEDGDEDGDKDDDDGGDDEGADEGEADEGADEGDGGEHGVAAGPDEFDDDGGEAGEQRASDPGEANAGRRPEPQPGSGFTPDDELLDQLLAVVRSGPPPPPPPRRERRAIRRGRCRCGGRVVPRAKMIFRADVTAAARGHATGDEICDVVGYGPISVATLREFLPDAVIHVLTTKGDEILNVASPSRRAREALVSALQFSNPYCANIGCDNTHFIQIDHRLGYANVARTCLDEFDHLCSSCHRIKTTQNWQLVAGTGRRRLVPPEHPDHPGDSPTPRWRPSGANQQSSA